MAKKKNTIPSGFEDILGNIYSNAEQGEGSTDMDTLMEPNVPLVEDDNDDDVPPVNNNPEDGDNQDHNDDDPNAHEDNSPEPPVNNVPPVDNNTPPVEDNNDEGGEPSEADVIEAQQVGLFFDALGASLGWNMDEID
jgi:hypothetical protein